MYCFLTCLLQILVTGSDTSLLPRIGRVGIICAYICKVFFKTSEFVLEFKNHPRMQVVESTIEGATRSTGFEGCLDRVAYWEFGHYKNLGSILSINAELLQFDSTQLVFSRLYKQLNSTGAEIELNSLISKPPWGWPLACETRSPFCFT